MMRRKSGRTLQVDPNVSTVRPESALARKSLKIVEADRTRGAFPICALCCVLFRCHSALSGDLTMTQFTLGDLLVSRRSPDVTALIIDTKMLNGIAHYRIACAPPVQDAGSFWLSGYGLEIAFRRFTQES